MADRDVIAYIDDLASDLPPVRRIWSPTRRTALWLAAVAVVALGLAIFGDPGEMVRRLHTVPGMGLALCGSLLATVCGAVAVFRLCLPDASARWALLPLPGLSLWIAGTGFGCAEAWLHAGGWVAAPGWAKTCLAFIVLLSVPLSALTMVLVRRAYTLHPNLAALTGGIAVAAAAATLLNLFHPYDVATTDIVIHVAAIVVVVAANRVVGGRLLASERGVPGESSPDRNAP